jgi:putative tributyrin esterase
MALLQCNFFSTSLCFGTDINVIIPSPNADEILNHKKNSYFHKESKFQVLYLLHGAYGDCSDWLRLSGIERYANEHKLIIIMPSVSNSFYQDMYSGSDYLTYLTCELPAFVRATFPVSQKREHTFAAGLSMGGYGALKIAFQNPENYAACISLSGAIDICGIYDDIAKGYISGPFRWDAIFREPEHIQNTDADLFSLYQKKEREGYDMPLIFQSCGTEDFIYKRNLTARDELRKIGANVTYEEFPGGHDWDYWDTHIKRAIEWLPLANDAVAE